MSALRVAARFTAVVLWLLLCLPLHGGWRALGLVSPWPRRFLGGVAAISGARVRVQGGPAAGPALLLANHTSWLDILVLGGALGARFVSKDGVDRWPVVGFLARLNATIFISREARGAVRTQAGALRRELSGPRPIALFPEGTTTDGHALLPFRASLLAAVAPPPDGVAVLPVAIDYGAAVNDIAWFADEPALRNVARVWRRAGRFDVVVRVLPALPAGVDRKALAAAAQREVAAALRHDPHVLPPANAGRIAAGA